MAPSESIPLRSHRQIGEQLDLFHLPEHASGQACWHSAGLNLYRCLEEFIRERYSQGDYLKVRSPLFCDKSLWEKSGHWEKFSDKMIVACCHGKDGALKPMNCPGHCELYSLRPRSYRELPMRIAELGHVHRAELSGEINGLLRARGFVIDDAHIFAAPEQVAEELDKCLLMAREVYQRFGLEISAELSLRPEKRLGADEDWDAAESGLRAALVSAGIQFVESPGEGAFYGPKVDLHVHDSLGRAWQMGSVQLDYQLPERFDLKYVGPDNRNHDDDGKPYRPVMIHRALLGSFERFIAILLENDDGWLPAWCSPRQVALVPVSQEQAEAAKSVADELKALGIRVELLVKGSLGNRIREANELRIPAIAVIGKREIESGLISVRVHGKDEQDPINVPALADLLSQ
jgi:threonyl-tRNA synthetase